MPAVPESHRDLLSADFATLATVGRDGSPQLSLVWFVADDDTVRISLNDGRQKTKNLVRNPRCSLAIVDPANPYRYLELRGRAEIEPDPDYRFADRVGAKYSSDLREHDRAGESRVVVTIRPTRLRAVDMSG